MYYTEQMLRLIDRLTINFPIPDDKNNESNCIIFTKDSPSGIVLWLWTSDDTKQQVYLDSEDELDDIDKLIHDIKSLVTPNEIKIIE